MVTGPGNFIKKSEGSIGMGTGDSMRTGSGSFIVMQAGGFVETGSGGSIVMGTGGFVWTGNGGSKEKCGGILF